MWPLEYTARGGREPFNRVRHTGQRDCVCQIHNHIYYRTVLHVARKLRLSFTPPYHTALGSIGSPFSSPNDMRPDMRRPSTTATGVSRAHRDPYMYTEKVAIAGRDVATQVPPRSPYGSTLSPPAPANVGRECSGLVERWNSLA